MTMEAKASALAWAIPLTPILVSVLVMGGACLLLTTEDGPRLSRIEQRLVVELNDSETEVDEAVMLTTRTRTASVESRRGLAARSTSHLIGRSDVEPEEDARTRSFIPDLPGRGSQVGSAEDSTSEVNVGEEALSPEEVAERRERAKAALLGIGEKLPTLRNVPGFQGLKRLQDEARQEAEETRNEQPAAPVSPADGAASAGERREAQNPVQHENDRVPSMGGATGR
jgi:hypothetical protein